MSLDARPRSILALDVGGRRIGLARASSLARIAEPLGVVLNDADVWQNLGKYIEQENAEALVVGLPRGLSGQETAQTALVRNFVNQLSRQVSLPIVLQDEAVTSKQAEAELNKRGKRYAKGDIDALAATYILSDYLSNAKI